MSIDYVFPDVLHVRFPVPRVRDPRDHVLRDHHPAVLLPPVRRGLPLVVARLPQLGLHRRVPLHLLLPLLRHQAEHRRRRVYFPILRVYVHHGLLVLPTYGNNWVHGVLLVREEDIQRGQGRLSKG